jgi:23S rRNA pseudoU1915 N3-methylase RlmH
MDILQQLSLGSRDQFREVGERLTPEAVAKLRDIARRSAECSCESAEVAFEEAARLATTDAEEMDLRTAIQCYFVVLMQEEAEQMESEKLLVNLEVN